MSDDGGARFSNRERIVVGKNTPKESRSSKAAKHQSGISRAGGRAKPDQGVVVGPAMLMERGACAAAAAAAALAAYILGVVVGVVEASASTLETK